MREEVLDLTVPHLARLLRAGDVTSQDLVEASLARAARLDPVLGIFTHRTDDAALRDAARADAELREGLDRGPLHGLPVAVKDVVDVAGLPTTCHSHLRTGHVAQDDAPVVQGLAAAGGVLVGKLATHEFALGGPSFDLPFPPARNPWDQRRVPGASSSGSGVSVACRIVKVAVGTDTSGSVRNPAAHCGVYGLKPTFGVVPRRGVFPLSFSLDHLGPLVASADDLDAAFGALAAHDPRDPSSVALPPSSPVRTEIEGLRVGYAREFFATDPALDGEVLEALDDLARALADRGALVEEVRLPDFGSLNAVGRLLMSAESYAIHEQDLRARGAEFGRFTYQRVLPGVAVSGAEQVRAGQLRGILARAVDEVVRAHDVVLTANALTTAPSFDDFGPDWPPAPRATATRTIAFNVTGHPALAVPLGFSVAGLPLSAQLVGRAFGEAQVVATAQALEAAGLSGLPAPPLVHDAPTRVRAGT